MPAANLGGNFAADLHDRAGHREDHLCLDVPGGTALTYSEIDQWAARMATVLDESGAHPGDRVLVQVDKSAAAVALYLACLRAGVVHVPLNPTFTLGELQHFVVDAEPSVVVTSSARSEAAGMMAPEAQVLTLDADEGGTLTELALGCIPSPIRSRDDGDLAALVYTSGTTGKPKGAMVTHANLRHNAEALRRSWGFNPNDVLLHSLPIFHVHGLFVALHCAMLSGIPIHLLPRFDVDTVISLIPRSTVMMGVPTHYSRLMADPRFNAELCADIRLFTSGSAPLPAASFEAFANRTGHRLCERYGMSEAGIITSNPITEGQIAGTVGYPLPGYRVRVVDDSGNPSPNDTNGMVEITGLHLFAGYWRNSRATAESHRAGGWFSTGDIGRLSERGRLTLEGRAHDMIISGGENIHPGEIEAVLVRADCIAESAVVGVPHPDLGEAVVAVVVLDASATTIDRAEVDMCLDESLARFKHPKTFEVMEQLPRNAMGKIQKNELRLGLGRLFTSESRS